jgi:hypothetical protein
MSSYDGGQQPGADKDPNKSIQWEIQKIAKGVGANILGMVTGLLDTGLDAVKEWTTGILGGLLGLTATPLTIGSQIASILSTGLAGFLNGLFSGYTGVPAVNANSSDVGGAASSQTDVVVMLARQVALLQTQLDDADPLTDVVQESWNYTATAPDPAVWDVQNTTVDGSFASTTVGKWIVNGSELTWDLEGGSSNHHTTTLRYIGTDPEANADDMSVQIVLGTTAIPANTCFIDVLGRMSADNQTYTRVRIGTTTVELAAINAGVKTIVSTASIPSPGAGAIISVDFGTDDGHDHFSINIGTGAPIEMFDGAAVCDYGPTLRYRGMGGRAGQVVFFGTFQKETAPVTHWSSRAVH